MVFILRTAKRFGKVGILYNKGQNTMMFCPLLYIDLGNNIGVDPNIVKKKLTSEDLTIRHVPVGGHTCITAGEQGEPAVVLYERINLSVFVPLFRGTSKEFAEGVSGGPTAPGYATNYFNLSGCCGSSYGDR